MDKFLEWVELECNPERIKKGFNPLTKEEAIECWNIIDNFNKTFRSIKTTDA